MITLKKSLEEEEIPEEVDKLVTLDEAARWASEYLKKEVSKNNISYLINYGKILKYDKSGNWLNGASNGEARIDLNELKNYYDKFILTKEDTWKEKLGKDLDWYLSFDNLREKDTTKHVHRLHPYKGKFIPQLVEYFLDDHIDEFKEDVYFHQGDTVLDPFMGSGTTLVQALEMGINSVGIDVSGFNCSISRAKVKEYDRGELDKRLKNAVKRTKSFSKKHFNDVYDKNLRSLISDFNKKHFPSPEYKVKINKGLIDQEEYSEKMLLEFQSIYEEFKNAYSQNEDETKENDSHFISKWYSPRIRQELRFYLNLIDEVEEESIRDLMRIILSRTARSCRATTHSDLATLVEPVYEPYYCKKHYKICIPINTITTKLNTYTEDTIKRIKEFSQLRKNVFVEVIHSDSTTVDIFEYLKNNNSEFYELIKVRKIDGIFSSPPYVGQIDYHEQHAYAYELLGIERKDELEIGPLSKGKSKKAQEEYVRGISHVLANVKQFLKDDSNVFIVANDKFNLYPKIAKKSGFRIINEYKRPVLNRTERDKQPYSEKIFHMKRSI